MAKKISSFLGTLYWDYPSQKMDIEKDVRHILQNPNDATADWARYEINGSYNQLSVLEFVTSAMIYETTEADGSKKIRGWLYQNLLDFGLYNQDGSARPNTSQYYWVNSQGLLVPVKAEAEPGYCLVCWKYNFSTRRYSRYCTFFKREQANDLDDRINRIR